MITDVPKNCKIYCILLNPNSELIDFVESYWHRDKLHISQIFTSNLSQVLNYGLGIIAEPWVFRMDSDDVWEKGRFESQSNFLKENQNAWVLGGGIRVHNIETNTQYDLYTEEIQKIDKTTLMHGCPIAHPSTLLNRKRIMSIGGYNKNYKAAEDYELWSRVVYKGVILTQPDVLLSYTLHSNNQSSLYSDVQDLESTHVIFNMKTRNRQIPTCKLSHKVGDSFYCRFLTHLIK